MRIVRLPQPGADAGNWGAILNEFLAQAHQTDGTLKDDIITESQLAPSVVTKINTIAGQQGSTGPQGAIGATGIVGATGAIGATGASGPGNLTIASVKTANYTAAAGEYIPVNTTSGSITITLPQHQPMVRKSPSRLWQAVITVLYLGVVLMSSMLPVVRQH